MEKLDAVGDDEGGSEKDKDTKRRCSVNINNNSEDESQTCSKHPSEASMISEHDGLATEVLTAAHPIFSNHLILTEICKHLNVPDLLIFSLVNKFWKSNARTVLRENKKCLVKISKENPCVDLEEFLEFLPSIHEIPFNGLSIITSYRYDSVHECVIIDDPSKWSSFLLSKMDIKFLKFSWGSSLLCPAKVVIKKLLMERATSLEGLCFKHLTFNINSVSKSIFNVDFDTSKNSQTRKNSNRSQIWFPKLKSLEIPSDQNYTEDNGYCYPIVKELLYIAPNIKHLLGGIQPAFLEFISDCDKTPCVRQYYFQPGIKEIYWENDLHRRNMEQENNLMERDLQASLRFAKEKPKLQKLTFTTEYMKWRILRDPNPKDFLSFITEILKLFLESSCETMEELSISQLDLILLQSIGSPPMKRLKQLTIEYNRNVDKLEGYSTLARINYPLLFPYLQSVKICRTEAEELEHGFYITNLFRQDTREFNSTTVTQLKLGYEISDYPEIQDPFRACVIIHSEKGCMKDIPCHYKKLFPCVKKFSIYNCQNLKMLCKYLWTTWLGLETIAIKGLDMDLDDTKIVKNLDSAFTGVPEADWNSMIQSDDCLFEYDSYHPVGPSIRNLTNLKRLVIKINHDKVCKYVKSRVATASGRKPAFLSAAAATCTFAQMPNLSVELVRQLCVPYRTKMNCRLSFDHLTSFVKLINAVHLGPNDIDDYSASSDSESDSSSNSCSHSRVRAGPSTNSIVNTHDANEEDCDCHCDCDCDDIL